MISFGDLVLQGRRRQRLTQEQLADQVESTKQWLSRIERGDKPGSIELAISLYNTLDANQPEGTPLIGWLLAWLAASAQHEGKLSDEQMATLDRSVADILRRTMRVVAQPRPSIPRSLVDFPHAFYPLTIICGDRRETSPRTRGDMFAYSLAITDLTYLAQLGLDQSVPIRSDKLFMVMDETYLRQEFAQTNLLIIGSPAVNFAARMINNTAVFRFELGPETAGWQHYVASRQPPKDRNYLQIFWEMAQGPKPVDITPYRDLLVRDKPIPLQDLIDLAALVDKLLGRSGPKELMNAFRKPGIIDLADDAVHAQTTRDDNDFAVISLARNPFAAPESPYVSIMVGGIHGPGTAHALRALAHSAESFRDHPFGGVIEVQIDTYKDWPARFEQGSYTWQTRNYTPQDLLSRLQQAHEQIPRQRSYAFSRIPEERLKECLALVKDLLKGNLA